MMVPFEVFKNTMGKIISDLGFQNLGIINACVNCLCFGTTSMFAPKVTRKYGAKKTLIVCGLTYSLWIGTTLFPAYKSESNDKAQND